MGTPKRMRCDIVKAILFDLDGVLVDSEVYTRNAWRKYLPIEKFNKLWPICLGVTAEKEFQIFNANLGWNKTQYESFVEKVKSCLPTNFPIKPGVHKMIQNLKFQKFKLAIVSSSSYKSIITKFPLYSQFDLIVSGDQVKCGKPDPAIYDLALTRLHMKASECVAVEDSVNGIMSAVNNGIFPIMYVDTIPAIKNVLTINSFQELKNAIKLAKKVW